MADPIPPAPPAPPAPVAPPVVNIKVEKDFIIPALVCLLFVGCAIYFLTKEGDAPKVK